MRRPRERPDGRYVEGVGWYRRIPSGPWQPNLLMVSGPSPYFAYTDASGTRTFDVPPGRAPAFRDFLDTHLDRYDAANELPDGSLP